MRMLRALWLMVLTLVASALPASARSAPVRKQGEPAVQKAACADSARPSPEDTSKPKKVKITPVPELWDGSSSRLSGKSSPAPAATDALPAGDPCGRIVPPLPRRASSSPLRSSRVPHPAVWLIGHYAHAPPPGA